MTMKVSDAGTVRCLARRLLRTGVLSFVSKGVHRRGRVVYAEAKRYMVRSMERYEDPAALYICSRPDR